MSPRRISPFAAVAIFALAVVIGHEPTPPDYENVSRTPASGAPVPVRTTTPAVTPSTSSSSSSKSTTTTKAATTTKAVAPPPQTFGPFTLSTQSAVQNASTLASNLLVTSPNLSQPSIGVSAQSTTNTEVNAGVKTQTVDTVKTSIFPSGGVTLGQTVSSGTNTVTQSLKLTAYTAPGISYSFTTTPGFGAGASASFKVAPSYHKGEVIRTDNISFNANVNPLSYLPALGIPVGFALQKTNSIQFERPYKDNVAAYTAPLANPASIPATAEMAKKNLKPGDGVVMNANLNLVVGMSQTIPIPGVTAVTPAVNEYLVASGNYQVHFYRLEGNKIRVKFVGQQTDQAGVSASLGMNGSNINFTLLTNLNTAISKQPAPIASALNTDVKNTLFASPLDVHADVARTDTGILDYTYNLDDPKAAAAFNKIMGATFKLDAKTEIVPTTQASQLKNMMLTDLRDTESLYQTQKNLPADKRVVDRIADATGTQTATQAGVHAGIALLGFDLAATRATATTKVQSLNWNDQQRQYEYDSTNPSSHATLFFGLIKDTKDADIGGVYRLDTDAKTKKDVKNFVAFAHNTKTSKTFYTANQVAAEERRLQAMLPPDMRNQLPPVTTKGAQPGTYKNIHLSTSLFIKKETWDKIGPVSEAQVRAALQPMCRGGTIEKILPIAMLKEDKDAKGHYQSSETGCTEHDVSEISQYLAVVTNKKYRDQDRVTYFRALNNNFTFKSLGDGLLLRLIPQADRPKYVRYEYQLSGDGLKPPITVSYGLDKSDDEYEQVAYVLNAMKSGPDGRPILGADGHLKAAKDDKGDKVLDWNPNAADDPNASSSE